MLATAGMYMTCLQKKPAVSEILNAPNALNATTKQRPQVPQSNNAPKIPLTVCMALKKELYF